MEEPVGLQSMGLQRVGHDLATSLHFHYKLGTVLGTEDRAENTADKSLALTELEPPAGGHGHGESAQALGVRPHRYLQGEMERWWTSASSTSPGCSTGH